MSFLTAEWRKLAIANYQIEPSILTEHLPFGTELDTWQDKCYVSLIGFMFMDTRLLGLKIPYHRNFEEVNLRFYVKRFDGKEWKRGVVFIKEIVPKFAITMVANTIYNENYETLPMKHEWCIDTNQLKVNYQWKKDAEWYSFKINAENHATEIEIGSETEFITEHYWGYAKTNQFETTEYQVAHPRWLKYKVIEYEINADFGRIYGEKFGFLTNQKPDSVMLIEGSQISVENGFRFRSAN
jgi:uncharacterized protein